MVLPASPVAHAPRQGVERWIHEIQAGLRLSPAGVLVLVDGAVDEQLGKLVRSLLSDHPDLEVLVDPAHLAALPDGSVVVLAPPRSAAGWLNEHRPLFARKALKVVLWCDRETSVALAQEAPDFFDWISQRQECPPAVAEHAVWGLRRALCARAPGVLFLSRSPSKEGLERVFRVALPGRRLRWLDSENTQYSTLVREVRSAGRDWVACLSWNRLAAERFRWALAEAGRRTRAVLVGSRGGEDWFWRVTDNLWTLSNALPLLSKAGARHPGRLAAVSGLEIPVVFGLLDLLIRGYREEDLLAALLACPDPGAGLAERLLSSGVQPPPRRGDTATAPVQRHLGRMTGLRRTSPRRPLREPDGWHFDRGSGLGFMSPQAEEVEYLLCRKPRTAEMWTEVARLALDHGDTDAAAAWAQRSLSMQDSVEARRILAAVLRDLQAGRDDGWPEEPIRNLLALGETTEALAFADDALQRGLDGSERLNPARVGRMRLFARVLRRAGRFKDAELLLRKLLGLPISDEPSTVGDGLVSQPLLQVFLRGPGDPAQMPYEMRVALTSELAEVLRAQGRYAEADEVIPDTDTAAPRAPRR